MKKRRLITVILAFVLCIGLVIPLANVDTFAARSDFDIEVNGSPSNGGDSYTIDVDITNNDDNFTGTMRVCVSYDSYSVGYDVDISIPKGSTKTYTVTVPARNLAGLNDIVVVKINNLKGKQVYKEKFSYVFNDAGSNFNLGILSDHPDRLSNLDNDGDTINYNGNKSYVKLVEVDDTKLTSELSNLNGLIINDYDTSTLSDETVVDIMNWVSDGGVLVLGLGKNGERVLSGLELLIDVQIDGDYEVNYTDFENNGLSGTYTVSNITYGPDFMYASSLNEYAFSGSGLVDVYAFDLDEYNPDDYDTNFAVNDLFNNRIQQLGSNINGGSQLYYNSLNQYNLENYQGYMEKPVKSGTGVLALIMIVYIVLIGPIIYLILKAVKKQEMIWIAIPALSVLFVGFVFLVSLGVRVRGISLKSITATDLGSGSTCSYIVGYAPDPDEWTIETKDNYLYGDVIGSYSYSEEDVDAAIKTTNGSEQLTYYPDAAFATGCFEMYSKKKVTGGFEIDEDELLDDISGYSGSSYVSVKNNTGYDFDFVLVICNSNFYVNENIDNGEIFNANISTGSGSNYYSSEYLLSNEARPYYEKKEYEKSGAIASMALVGQAVQGGYGYDAIILGVRKSQSITKENETAWEVYYQTY